MNLRYEVKKQSNEDIINFHSKLAENRTYLKRHFHGSFRRWLAYKLLGKDAVSELLYDAADTGWSICHKSKKNNEF